MKTRTYISMRYDHIVIAGLPRASPYESGPVDRLLTATGGLRIMFSLNAVLLQFVFLVFLIAYHEYPVLFVEHDGQVIVRVDDVGQ